MDGKNFRKYRKKLNKTQKQIAQLLGVSIKAVHSYEQGWRSIPVHVERQFYFLLARKISGAQDPCPCWNQRECPEYQREQCPVWEFASGNWCWFVSGTICGGVAYHSWKDKMVQCRTCPVFESILEKIDTLAWAVKPSAPE
ncbi:helix-turn-helix domain-containing protein [Desulfosarcina sp. OttesenSCG-928-A07]|nr:helix-turn-helix domain-containing protein [Desulfosarcina sp. OttesenSCG-928-G17]MDL2328702.1 helix-turn-helix domain-containing protein [Desulfosarcina sp. OttesenSCG-928-A07]